MVTERKSCCRRIILAGDATRQRVDGQTEKVSATAPMTLARATHRPVLFLTPGTPLCQISRYLRSLSGGAAIPANRCPTIFVAAVIVTIMLIPQSLAYAMLCRPAGLEAGDLCLHRANLVLCGAFGTPTPLAVGPGCAVVSVANGFRPLGKWRVAGTRATPLRR